VHLALDGQHAASVARHVELGHHADSPIRRVRDDFADVALRIETSLRAHQRRRQIREQLGLDPKAAHVADVQV